MTTAAVYARISADRSATGLGVARQEEDCRALIAARGWALGEVYVDNDVSAYKGRQRPAYERMMAAVEAGAVDAVVAWHPDRLHRSPVELERFIDLIEAARAKVATVQGGEYDLGTASGRMTARVVGAVARHESEHKSERLRRKAQELAKAGKVGGGGTRPYGFERDRRTVIEAEADIIREAARRVLTGETLRGVAADLNARSIKSSTGVHWTTHVLKQMLVSPRIAGLRQHRGEVVAEAEWPPIIDRRAHEQLRALLLDPARRKNQLARSYLLTGFAMCGLCEAKLVARPNSRKARCYVCASGPGFHGCGKIRTLAEPLEDLVRDAIFVALDSPATAARLNQPAPSDDGSVASVRELEARLDELAEAWADGQIDRRSWLAARARIDERLVKVRAELRREVDEEPALRLVQTAEQRTVGAWQTLAFDARRAVVAATIDRVTVNPAVRGRNTFDSGRVDVTWRN